MAYDDMAYNTALKLAMIERRVRQITVAHRAGIHESRFSKIVNGHDQARADEKAAIARVLRKPVDQLFPPEQEAVA